MFCDPWKVSGNWKYRVFILNISIASLSVAVEWIAFLRHIWKILGSYPTQEIGYPEVPPRKFWGNFSSQATTYFF
jgi:hypothetical protein